MTTEAEPGYVEALENLVKELNEKQQRADEKAKENKETRLAILAERDVLKETIIINNGKYDRTIKLLDEKFRELEAELADVSTKFPEDVEDVDPEYAGRILMLETLERKIKSLKS